MAELKGTRQFRRNMRKLRAAGPLHKFYAKELFRGGEIIMRKAKLLTPVDTGNLRSTGHVQIPRIKPKSVTVTLGFGGTAGPSEPLPRPDKLVKSKGRVGYAVKVHEDVRVSHTVGQAKYLEQPFIEERPEIHRRLGVRTSGFIRRRVGRVERI